MGDFAYNGGLCNGVNDWKEIQQETFFEEELPFSIQV